MARAKVSLNPLVLVADILRNGAESLQSAKCEMDEQLRSFIWDDFTGQMFINNYEEDFKPITDKLIPAINDYLSYIGELECRVAEYGKSDVTNDLLDGFLELFHKKRLSKEGANVIKEFESLRLEAYKCPAGIPTIGWGHTRGVKLNTKISRKQAEDFFTEDVKSSVEYINKFNKELNENGLKLRQNQFDALVSFVFNCGIENFNKSTLKKKILAGADDSDIAKEFRKWHKVKNAEDKLVPSRGLIKRREEEIKLWMKKDS